MKLVAVVLDVTPCLTAGEPATAVTRARECAEGKLNVKRAVAVLDGDW